MISPYLDRSVRSREEYLAEPSDWTVSNLEYWIAARLAERPGTTIAGLADRLGLHRATLYRYLSGELPIPRKVALACKALMTGQAAGKAEK